MKSLGLVLIAVNFVWASIPLNKVLLPDSYVQQYGSRCLDGSPSGYYYAPSTAPPSSPDYNSWVFYMQGGGLCVEPIDCYIRYHTIEGSSKNWSATWTDNEGVLSNNSFNPFGTFNHVYIPYCSGDTHTGTQMTPDLLGYYFAGHLSFAAILIHLKATTHINNSVTMLLSGGSAGGIGVFNNIDYLSAQFPNTKVKAAPQAGYFFPNNVVLYEEWILGRSDPFPPFAAEYLATIFTSYVDESCAKANPSFPKMCWDAGFVYEYIETPLFLVNNLYDQSQLDFLGYYPELPESDEYLAYYGNTLYTSVTNTTRPQDGYFLPSCYDHTGDLCMASTTTIRGITYAQALADWFFEKNELSHTLVDECWAPNKGPCNPVCPSYCG